MKKYALMITDKKEMIFAIKIDGTIISNGKIIGKNKKAATNILKSIKQLEIYY